MKIYEIGTGYTPIPAQVAAATESVVEELTKAFLQKNIDVEILDISSLRRVEHNLPIVEIKVPSFFTGSDVSLGIVHKVKRVVYSLALAQKLKKILRSTSEKVVLHFHNQYNLFFFIKTVSKKLRSKAMIAYTNHNGLWSLPWEEVKGILNKRYFQEIAAMKNADIVFVLNNKTKDTVSEYLGIAKERLIKIDNGVNTDIYCPLPESEVEAVKNKYNLTDKRIILQVGSVYENKGQARSVKLLAPILKNNPHLVFAFAGEIVSQEYYNQVFNSAANLGIEEQVIYLGSFSPGMEMNKIYNIADISLFVSQYESFGLVCIESLSAGVPVILCSDSLINFGDGCISSSPDTFEETVLQTVFSDDSVYLSLSNDSRKNVINNYSWSKIAQDHINAFLKNKYFQ